MRFSAKEKQLISAMVAKFAKAQEKNRHFRAIDRRELFALLTKEERDLCRRVLALDPRCYGFKGRYFGKGKPGVLVRVPTSMVRNKEVHFLPKNVFMAFKKMRAVLKKEHGEDLLVDSGYRSYSYQLVVLLRTLCDDGFDLAKTATWCALPGYSEHGAPARQAIDLIVPAVPENRARDHLFERTKAYRWLLAHAHKYGFHLSYPRDNEWGVAFEPWHWHYEGIRNRE